MEEATPEVAEILRQQDVGVHERAAALARLTQLAQAPGSAEDSIDAAVSAGLLPSTGHLLVMVLDHDLDDPDLQRDIARAHMTRPFMAHASNGHLVAILRTGSPRDDADALITLERLASARGGQVMCVGIARALTTSELPQATNQARFARDLQRLSVRTRGATRWEDLGTWTLHFGRQLDCATVAAISPDAETLVRSGTADQRATAVAYLDNGRSVAATCAQLSIHRATLHYRVERIREILGVGVLDDGWRSVSLHVALKLHRLIEEASGTKIVPRPAPRG